MLNLDIEKCIVTWNEQWKHICAFLEDNQDCQPKFEELITDEVFIDVIAEILKYKDLFTVQPSDIPQYFRGVKENNISNLSPQRFIPEWKYVCKDYPNRMNGTDRLYNYFTISYPDCRNEELFYTAAHELRLTASDSFWGCFFTIPQTRSNMKFIDLRSRSKIPKTNKSLLNFLKIKIRNPIDYTQSELQYWIIQSIFNIWENSNMFDPINDRQPNTLWAQYRPFHILCDYFERNGFDGIIYRSTVYKKGACLALFNIENAKCEYSTLSQLNTVKYIGRK